MLSDRAKLADRLRAIVASGTERVPHESAGVSWLPSVGVESAGGNLEGALGGTWENGADGRCLVVERVLEASTPHGNTTVGQMAAQVADTVEEARLVPGCAAARPPLLFFDLETTGLSGGAGTYAFLAGCGWFEKDGSFAVRQFVLTRTVEEPQWLQAVAREFGRAGSLVSFNGRTFDAPLLETRYAYHRLPWVGQSLPHLDVLYPARRFWRDSGPPDSGGAAEGGCSLGALERQLLGAHRHDDVPGHEIPARYFNFLRSGDARLLAPVLSHNRLDLLSLAALTARLLHLLHRGPDAADHAREALALGRLYGQAGLEARSREALARAAGLDGPSLPGTSAVRADGLRALALAWRRARRHDEAAGCWRRLLEAGCPAHIAREASQALAIHHEHRVRDLAAARRFAIESLAYGRGAGWREAVRDRLSRIERKMAGAAASGALDLK